MILYNKNNNRKIIKNNLITYLLFISSENMQFPYNFKCEYSTNQTGPFITCDCSIQQLFLTLEFKLVKKHLEFYCSEYKTKQFSLTCTHVLLYYEESIYLKFLEMSDFRIAEKLFEILIPLQNFSHDYKKYQRIEQLCDQNIQIYAAENRKTKMIKLVRDIQFHKLEEIQIINKINNRCCFKPQVMYNQGYKVLTLVYQMSNGKYLNRVSWIKDMINQMELKEFIKKLLVFIDELQKKGIQLENLSQSTIILEYSKLNYPHIMDFSSAYLAQSKSKSKLLIKLSAIIYKLLFFRSPNPREITKLKRYLNKQIPLYSEYFNVFKKSFFQFLFSILTDPYQNPLIFLSYRWFHQPNDPQYRPLQTILSVEQQCKAFKLEFQSTQQNDIEQFEQAKDYLTQKMQLHIKNIKVPFRFLK